MSDFLHNLRTGNLKRFDRPRKTYDNPQNRNPNERHSGKDRKGNYQKKAYTGDQLQEIKKHLEVIGQSIESNLKAQERSASALERIAMALETATGIKLAPVVQDAITRQPQAQTPAFPEAEEKEPETPTISEAALLATITAMRNDGVSFDKIAAELEEREIPTVSGRGKWRGPAVSKLLKEHA